MLKIQNKSAQVIYLTFQNASTVNLYSRQSIVLDESLLTTQIKNLEKQKILKVTRI